MEQTENSEQPAGPVSPWPEHDHILIEAIDLGASHELVEMVMRGLCAYYGVPFYDDPFPEEEYQRLIKQEAATESGKDWEENLEQIAREKARMRELGITPGDLDGAV